MKRSLRFLWACAPLFLASLAQAKDLPNINAYHAARSVPSIATVQRAAPPAFVSSFDEKRGVPTFLWAARLPQGAPSVVAGLRAEDAALVHLGQHAARYGLTPDALATARVTQVHDLGHGARIVVLRQQIGGIELFHNDVKVVMDRNMELVAIGGNLHAAAVAKPRTAPFKLSGPQAIANAFQDLHGIPLQASDLLDLKKTKADYRYYDVAQTPGVKAAGLHFIEPARVKKVYFPMPDRLVPAYFLELLSGKTSETGSDAYGYVIAADDGRILYRENLTHYDAFNYRVYADPTGDNRPADGPLAHYNPYPANMPNGSYPPYAAPNLISMSGFNTNPSNTSDPWLPPGATVATGNNVDAYTDDDAPDGFSPGDIRATTTGPNTFDRTYDPSLGPQSSDAQKMASLVDMFYVTNWLHDWWYDSGFDEAAGNAQQSNYGRGGIEGDPLHAEGQDGAPTSRNNSNMSAMADGTSPRMQMYVWDGVASTQLNVQPPNQNLATGAAAFGPQTYAVTGQAVLVNDGQGTVTDACQAITNDISGKIALIDRGTCSFKTKTVNAQSAGAVGVLIADDMANVPPPQLGDGPPNTTVSIPVLAITMADGAAIKASLTSGPVSVSMSQTGAVDRDGTIDNSVVAHEWGHYLHLRLVSCGAQQCLAQSEGWADFNASMMSIRPGDDYGGSWAVAQYAVASFPDDPAYFGIRRYPYSTDFGRNALTFKDISNGQALPTGIPTASFADPANNSEVHNAGEVWCSMLFESYVALLQQTVGVNPPYGYPEAHRRMSDYIVGGMKAAPVDPTYTEQRDGVLAAALAGDPNDFAVMAQAFARRGAGSCAVSPPRDSTDFTGVVESFTTSPGVFIVSVSVDDSVKSCDNDGYLDDDEIGEVTVKVLNTGSGSLDGATLQVSTPLAGVTFPDGATVMLPSVPPLAMTTSTVRIALDGSLTTKATMNLTVTVTAPTACQPTTTLTTSELVNVDKLPNASTSDDFEAAPSVWTLTGAQSQKIWSRIEATPGDHAWLGADFWSPSDTAFVSPPLQVSTTDPLILTFDHRYTFEYSMNTYWDGGVLEVTTNGGGAWDDITMYANDPGYGGTIGDPTNQATNVLKGRQGFVNQNAAWPARETVTVNAGMALAGQTIQLRYRIGTDDATGAYGWEIDNVALQGITNKPFPELVDDMTTCTDAIVADAGPDQTVTGGVEVQLDGTKSSDPAGGTLGYSWAESDGTMTVALAGDTTATPTFTAPLVTAPTTLVFKLTVSDSNGAASDTVNVLVQPGGTMTTGGMGGAGGGAGTGGSGPTQFGGCGCFVAGDGTEAPLWTAPLVGLAALLLRRRRRAD